MTHFSSEYYQVLIATHLPTLEGWKAELHDNDDDDDDVFAQMHSRLESEMTDAKLQMDKEFEVLKANGDVQLKAMEQRHERDREALRRTGTTEEGKMQRSLQPKHDAEMRQQQMHLKKEYSRIKDTFKKVMYNVVIKELSALTIG